MILSDYSIQQELKNKNIVIEPFDERNLQPSSYDVSLFNKFIVYKTNIPLPTGELAIKEPPFINPKYPNMLTHEVEIEPDSYLDIEPGQFLLGSTVEIIGVSDELVGRLEGKSSLGRYGLFIHATAGYVDPGWYGRLTLELLNVAPFPIRLWAGMKIGQISFQQLTTKARKKYGDTSLGSKYHGDMGPVESKMHLNT